ncbi:MAG: methyltransferase domain-containing protein [Phycisphaerales bacterium]|nr:methyltransferase domain-containing protein [Phycisphaerales bacterium]
MDRANLTMRGIWLALALALAGAAAPVAQNPPPPTEQEQSVKPGINDRWKSDDIAPLVETLDDEGREIFSQREKIAALVGPRKGSVVADIGAGSGFMAELFAGLVGEAGKVYAVDINAGLMERLAKDAADKGINNIETVVCGERSVDLPANSVDLMFICDTYHHFEYPVSTMRSIYEALRPGGQLVVVDFYRIEGESSEWILGHVRAGEEVFTQEIVDAGFELVNQHYPPYLPQNYVLRFRKVER